MAAQSMPPTASTAVSIWPQRIFDPVIAPFRSPCERGTERRPENQPCNRKPRTAWQRIGIDAAGWVLLEGIAAVRVTGATSYIHRALVIATRPERPRRAESGLAPPERSFSHSGNSLQLTRSGGLRARVTASRYRAARQAVR